MGHGRLGPRSGHGQGGGLQRQGNSFFDRESLGHGGGEPTGEAIAGSNRVYGPDFGGSKMFPARPGYEKSPAGSQGDDDLATTFSHQRGSGPFRVGFPCELGGFMFVRREDLHELQKGRRKSLSRGGVEKKGTVRLAGGAGDCQHGRKRDFELGYRNLGFGKLFLHGLDIFLAHGVIGRPGHSNHIFS